MDGENDAAQSGGLEAGAPGAASQEGGNSQSSGSGTGTAQEVAGAQSATAGDGAGGAASKSEDSDFQKQIDERDSRISELEAQLADQKVDHELELAGCRSTRAAKALLGDHNGDVAALKEAEPWLFNDSNQTQTKTNTDAAESGTTGLRPASAEQSAAAVERWERLAGLKDDEVKE